jgi:serine/threonine protein kinase
MSPAANDELSPGERLGDFRVLALLGRGGMGAVYQAEDESLGRRVALKVIRSRWAEDPGFRRRFEAEARNAAAIEHPNVVPIFSAGTLDGRLYIVMRYVEGPDLEARLRQEPRGALSPDSALMVLEGVAAALDAAHERGLVHRDVKPANILLEDTRGRERVFLTDFGLTRPQGPRRGETSIGNWIGTPDYAAPEQQESGWVDARTDVFSLGVVLYRMLSGEPPRTVGLGLLPSIEGVDPSLDLVIRRALARDPAERFASAGALARAARSAAAGDGVPTVEESVATGEARTGFSEAQDEAETRPFGSPAPTQPMPPGRAARSRRRLVLPALAAFAILAGIGVAVAIAAAGGTDSTTIIKTTAATVTEETPDNEPTASSSEEPDSTSGDPAAEASAPKEPEPTEIEASLFEGAAYSIAVPSDWEHRVNDERSSEGFYTNKWFDPEEPATYIRSDGGNPYTAGDVVEGTREFVEANEAAGYQTISYGPDSLERRPAARWVYLAEGDKRSDYFFTECGLGMAVVGSAPQARFAQMEQLFREVAGSTRLYCGE